MISRISTFTNLPMPLKVGLLVVSGAGIMAAIRYILPPQLWWIVFIGLTLVALLLLLYWRLLKRLKKRKAAPMQRDLMENTSAIPRGVSKPAHVARLDDLRKQFESGIEKFQAAGKSLYNFPWYIIVGEPGSGKTEAIRHCNVGFPPGLQDQFQGAGGTVNMNWWFTDHAVILDTAGRLMFEEAETEGSSEWKEFLNLLKNYRTRCPINGVLLVIPADSLIKDTADEIEQKASKIARQFDVIQRALDVRFPVFVVIAKSDLINGFRDFFENLDDPQLQHQILGWSNPAPLDEPYTTDFVEQHLKAIQGRLFRRRLALMQEIISDESGAEKIRTADTLYAFPQSLTKIAPRMARYLELIFSVGSQWSCKPLFFRGIYFTSSMREGSALDEDLAESLGVQVDSLPDGRVWERDRAYFLRDLFIKKVFREQGLVTHATNAKKLHSRRKATVLISAAASVILLLFFTFYAASRFSKSIGNMKYYLGAALNDSGELNELQVIKREGDDNWRYIGRAGIPGMPKGVMRFNFSARLGDTIGQWEKKGVPWIFAPAAIFTKGIKPDRLNKAQAVLYEVSVLEPFLDVAGDMMDTQKSGKWTLDDPETNALCQLIRIKANKSLNEDEDSKYSTKTLLDPLFAYIFRRDEDNGEEENFEKLKKMYDEDRIKLHQPLGTVYREAWPPESLNLDPNSRDPAIEHGTILFNEYWKDPNLIGAHSRDYAQAEAIEKLKDALEKFDAAEKRILGLHDSFDIDKWNKNFTSLNEASESISNYSRTLKSPLSLEDLWTVVSKNILQEVNKNYEFLLIELKEAKKEDFLSDIRDKLEKAHSEIINKIRKSEFEDRLKLLNESFYAQIQDGSHLYEIRFKMYSKANEQLDKTISISGLNQVPGAVGEVKRAVIEAHHKIDELLNLDRAAFRFQKAADISKFALGLAEQEQLYDIAKGALEVAPKNIEELEDSIEKEAKEDWEDIIPLKIVKRRYDPTATRNVLDGWKLVGDILKNYPFPEHLKETYQNAEEIYTISAKRYLEYWLETIPYYLIRSKIPHEDNWKGQHGQLERLDVLDVFAGLSRDGKFIKERALDKFENYALDGDEKGKQFRNNIEKLGEKFFQRKCERVLDKWGDLSDDAFDARDTILKNKPISLAKDYFPFSASSPAEFVDMYWTELTQISLHILADEIQNEGEKAFNKLRKSYSSKFPLARDSTYDLPLTELKEARSLLGRVLSQKEYVPGTIGDGAETEVTEVNKQLDQLREIPLSESDKEWTRAIRQVFQGLPEGEEQYYCKITLLSEKEQHQLLSEGEELLLDDLTAFRFVQGTYKSGRFRTRSGKDLSLDTIKYPGPSIGIEFYRFPSDIKPHTSLEFSKPWACLRMLHQCYQNGKKGYIKLMSKDKQGLGGVLYLQLEFYKDNECKVPLDLLRPKNWPSLKGKY